ncbi:hypothetical protein EI94DRAFT_1706436 [Lactarius quietus]|nr:hypothetical protein EI94DRAFT_1706436 [Lactarius quietus]
MRLFSPHTPSSLPLLFATRLSFPLFPAVDIPLTPLFYPTALSCTLLTHALSSAYTAFSVNRRVLTFKVKALESLYGGAIVVRVVIGTHGDFVKNDEVELSELVVGLPKSAVASHRQAHPQTPPICPPLALWRVASCPSSHSTKTIFGSVWALFKTQHTLHTCTCTGASHCVDPTLIMALQQMSHHYSFKSTDQICLSEALQEMPNSHEDSVYLDKLAEQAEHYEEMVENMKRVASSD